MRLWMKSNLIGIGILAVLAGMTPALVAQQNSIQLFGPIDVRLSAAGTGYGTSGVFFNTTNLNLTCPASGIHAVLSSTQDGTGNVLVDNNLYVTDTAGTSVIGPTDVCTGGAPGDSPTVSSCFTVQGYQVPASAGTLTGQDPDTFVASGGVPPIDVSLSLVPGQQQLTIALQDEGSGTSYFLANSTIYLDTNCTQGGVTGPALVNGNPIPSGNPTPQQLTQNFSFNPTTNQQVGFVYDLSPAQTAGTLSITDQTIPQVADSPLDPATFQTVWATGTSFATSICLVHSGEQLPNGNQACKLYTLECTVGTGATASGAQCPVSAVSNEVIQDVFDGPAFTLSDIPTPNGPTFHEGIGLLMASEGWTGGPCTFDPAAQLTSLPCPQNLLTSFSGPGLYDGTSHTSHPNSTFLSIAQVPEDLTTITVAGQNAAGWINTSTANVALSSQPPVLPVGSVPNAANFVASPIQSITYGISSPSTVPAPGNPVPSDTVLPNTAITCPTQAAPTGIPAAVFTPGTQTLTGLADGYYLLHYFAQDCAGTMELKFTQDGTGSWSTNFYTYAINVDTTAPTVASGPVLSPAPNVLGVYTVGEAVTASYSCADSLSGVAKCGTTTYSTPVGSTPTLQSLVDTSSPGTKTFQVIAVDAAGNPSTAASVSYQVVADYDSQVQFSISPSTVSYPGGTTVTVNIVPPSTPSALSSIKSARSLLGEKKTATEATSSTICRPGGTIQILDGAKTIQTVPVPTNGSVKTVVSGLGAGQHVLSVHYSGDGVNPAGNSAPVGLTVLPGPVKLSATCAPSGANYGCLVFANASGTPAQGTITYQLDGGATRSESLLLGFGLITEQKLATGAHTLTIGFAAQGSYLAAPSLTQNFTTK